MRVLLDEDVPHPLVRALPDHDVRTVAGLGWSGIKNGELLNLVDKNQFDVFLTGDKNLRKQQRLKNRPFAVVVLSAINWTVIRKHLPTIAQAVDTARPGTVRTVQCGLFLRHRTKGISGPAL